MKYDAPPVVTKAAVQKEVGKYKVDKIALKVTGKPVEKNKVWTIGAFALAGENAAKVAELKGKTVIVVGTLVEDDKGKQSLEVSSVEEMAKKK